MFNPYMHISYYKMYKIAVFQSSRNPLFRMDRQNGEAKSGEFNMEIANFSEKKTINHRL